VQKQLEDGAEPLGAEGEAGAAEGEAESRAKPLPRGRFAPVEPPRRDG
jgi:hypothetical protein